MTTPDSVAKSTVRHNDCWVLRRGVVMQLVALLLVAGQSDLLGQTETPTVRSYVPLNGVPNDGDFLSRNYGQDLDPAGEQGEDGDLGSGFLIDGEDTRQERQLTREQRQRQVPVEVQEYGPEQLSLSYSPASSSQRSARPSGSQSASQTQTMEQGITPGQISADPGGAAGRWRFIPSLKVGFRYDDNIYLRNDRDARGIHDDYVTSVAPRFTVTNVSPGRRALNVFYLSYEPTWNIYAENDNLSAVDHRASLEFNRSFSRIDLNISQEVSIVTDTDIDIGERSGRQSYETNFALRGYFTDKFSVEASTTFQVNDYDEGFDNIQVMPNLYFDYQLTPKLSIGVGANLGYAFTQDEVEGIRPGFTQGDNPDQFWVGGSFRAAYRMSEKLSIQGAFGANLRSFTEGSISALPGSPREFGQAGDQVNYTASVGINWQPWQNTVFALSANRGVSPSAGLFAQNYEYTGFDFNFQQRVAQKFRFNVNTGYSWNRYDSTGLAFSPIREDFFFYANPSVSFDFTKFASLRLYYLYRENQSDEGDNLTSQRPGATFYNHQGGISADFKF